MFSIPGTIELRITEASSLSGFANSSTGTAANCSTSSCEMKVSEIASWYPSASSVERTRSSFFASGDSTTAPAKGGSVLANLS